MSTKIDRPWGSEDLFIQNEKVTVKLLYIKKSEALSLQYHKHRSESWKIVEGSPEIIIGKITFHPQVGEEFRIAKGVNHRISAPKNDVVVLEISRGQFYEDDIIRIEDKYGRQ